MHICMPGKAIVHHGFTVLGGPGAGHGTVAGRPSSEKMGEERNRNFHSLTDRHLPIEIDAKEAVSRFLNVHGKSGGQSVNF